MNKKNSDTGQQAGGGLGGILKGLADLVEKLGDLTEKGESLSRSGEIHVGRGERAIRGIYGVSVRVGLGGEGTRVEPFGNVKRNETTGQPEVQRVREPLVDVFEEADHTLVVAEMPGIGTDDLKLDLTDDVLTLEAERGQQKYYKEVLLSPGVDPQKLKVLCNNGIVEIRCYHKHQP